MNMNRNSFILAGVLVVLVVAAYFLLQKQGERDISVDAAQHFVTLDSSSVDQISIKSSLDNHLNGIDIGQMSKVLVRAFLTASGS